MPGESTKTEEELREIAALAEAETPWGDFPDDCSWADVDAAQELIDTERKEG
jgi:hypothetical protein